ncbi:MAG: methionyl-tRNA formyltransferase [Pyrinomonadaceae bacterium]
MKVVFMGTPMAAAASLERLLETGHDVKAVYTQPDRPSGRGNRVTFSPVKEFAISRDLPVLQPTKIKTAGALETFRSHEADVVVVTAYGRILPKAFLDAFPFGAINVHFSLLPKYRGAAPVNWAIVNGETETGVTTMQMDEGLDTGDILQQRSTSIGDQETSIELMERLADVGAELLVDTLQKLPDIRPVPQDHQLATYAPIMRREDGLIDWNMTAAGISNRVRGFQPFPSAFTFFRGSRLTLWKAIRMTADASPGGYGTIAFVEPDSFLVRCGDETLLRVLEVQPEGKRRMSARDFINGFRLSEGIALG